MFSPEKKGHKSFYSTMTLVLSMQLYIGIRSQCDSNKYDNLFLKIILYALKSFEPVIEQ